MMSFVLGGYRFSFDWFFKSRTSLELAKRGDFLIKLIEKENEELEPPKGGKKRKAATSQDDEESETKPPPKKKGSYI